MTLTPSGEGLWFTDLTFWALWACDDVHGRVATLRSLDDLGPGMNSASEPADIRRHLTVVFSDLCNSTGIASQLEPEEYGELLDTLRRLVEPIIHRYGGEVVRVDGDGFLFVFGYQHAALDATRNAMSAALDLHDEIRRISASQPQSKPRLNIHTGINSGIVLIREGDIVRGRYELIGDTTNVAARLCDYANVDEILVRETAIGANRHQFKLSNPISVRLNQQREPIGARKLLGRGQPGVDAIPLAGEPMNFFGRADEVRRLLEFCDRNSGGIHLAAVVGEAGVGKTRLLTEIQREALSREQNVFWAACDPYLETAPLQPLRLIVLAILEQFEEAPDRLPGAPSEEALKNVQKFAWEKAAALDTDELSKLLDAIGTLLNAISTDRAAVWIIDDWHWADKLTQLALDGLADRLESMSLVVVLGSRTTPRSYVEMTESTTLYLEPLDGASASAAVFANAPFADPLLAREIATLSGGNPLYIEELCHAAKRGDRGLEIVQSETWLHTLTDDRFRSLDSKSAEVLQVASLLGYVVPERLLCRICKVEPDDPVFENLERTDFLFPGQVRDTRVFKHGLTQRAVYSLIPFPQRRKLHQNVVEILVDEIGSAPTQQDDGQLAYHYAGAGNPQSAIKHAVKAGRGALAASALDKAQKLFRFALQEFYKLSDAEEDIVRIVHLFGLASIVDPNREHDLEYVRVINWAGKHARPDAAAWAQYWQAFNLYGLGEPKRSLSTFLSAREKAIDLDDEQLALRIDGTIGQVYAANCDADRAKPALRNAIALQRDRFARSMNPSALSYSLACLAFTLADHGEEAASEALFREAEQILRGIDHEVLNSVLTYRGVACIWQGRIVEARRLLQTTKEIAARMRSRYIFTMSRALLGIVEFLETRDEAILPDVSRITDTLADASQQRISLIHGLLAEAYAQCGERAPARVHAARALWRARKGDRFGEVQAWRAIAILNVRDGKPEAASSAMQRADMAARARRSVRELELNRHLEQVLFGGGADSAEFSTNQAVRQGPGYPLCLATDLP